MKTLSERIRKFNEGKAAEDAARREKDLRSAGIAEALAYSRAVDYLGDSDLLGELENVLRYEDDAYPYQFEWQVNLPPEIQTAPVTLTAYAENGRAGTWKVYCRVLVGYPPYRLVWEKKYQRLEEVVIFAQEQLAGVESVKEAQARLQIEKQEKQLQESQAKTAKDAEKARYLEYLHGVYPQYVAARNRFAVMMQELRRLAQQTIEITPIEYGIVVQEDGQTIVIANRVDTVGRDGDWWLCICLYPLSVVRKRIPYVAAIHETQTFTLDDPNALAHKDEAYYPHFVEGYEYSEVIRYFITEDRGTWGARIEAVRQAAEFPIISREWPLLDERDTLLLRQEVFEANTFQDRSIPF